MTCHVFVYVLHVRLRLEFNDFPFMSSATRGRVSEEIPFDGGILWGWNWLAIVSSGGVWDQT